jgi:hypothetical protein
MITEDKDLNKDVNKYIKTELEFDSNDQQVDINKHKTINRLPILFKHQILQSLVRFTKFINSNIIIVVIVLVSAGIILRPV